MSVRQYIGARYVPLIMGEWDPTQTYEPLSVVTYQGNSYTSRQYVPVGVNITSEAYWALSANYNAQVEQYRQEITGIPITSEIVMLSDVYNASESLVSSIAETFTQTSNLFAKISGQTIQIQGTVYIPAFASSGSTMRIFNIPTLANHFPAIANGMRATTPVMAMDASTSQQGSYEFLSKFSPQLMLFDIASNILTAQFAIDENYTPRTNIIVNIPLTIIHI